MITKQYIVHGVVQGVGFRYFTYHAAQSIGIKGYVKNLMDGTVEIVATGTNSQHQELQKKISKGPSYSRVDYFDTIDLAEKSFASFDIH